MNQPFPRSMITFRDYYAMYFDGDERGAVESLWQRLCHGLPNSRHRIAAVDCLRKITSAYLRAEMTRKYPRVHDRVLALSDLWDRSSQLRDAVLRRIAETLRRAMRQQTKATNECHADCLVVEELSRRGWLDCLNGSSGWPAFPGTSVHQALGLPTGICRSQKDCMAIVLDILKNEKALADFCQDGTWNRFPGSTVMKVLQKKFTGEPLRQSVEMTVEVLNDDKSLEALCCVLWEAYDVFWPEQNQKSFYDIFCQDADAFQRGIDDYKQTIDPVHRSRGVVVADALYTVMLCQARFQERLADDLREKCERKSPGYLQRDRLTTVYRDITTCVARILRNRDAAALAFTNTIMRARLEDRLPYVPSDSDDEEMR